MKNQCGFVTIEIILVIMIISILAAVALPNMARLVDVATIDYEMKRFLKEMEFANSLNRISHYEPSIFINQPDLEISSAMFVDIKGNSYNLRLNDKVFASQELADGFSINSETFDSRIKIDEGKPGHVLITSRLGRKRYIYRDSVRRWSGGDIKERKYP